MKMNKKMLVGCAIICLSILTGAILSGCLEKQNLPDESDEGKKSVFLSSFHYDPEIHLPEVYIENQSIYLSTFNTSKWYTLPSPYDFIEKYSNHSKELMEIMKMQVALLGEDPELFEQCIYSIKEIRESLNDSNITCLPCWARKYTFTGLMDLHHEYDGVKVWEITFIIKYKHSEICVINTYYVDINTLTPFPFMIGTN